MLGRSLFQSTRRVLAHLALLATGALGASVYAAYQLEWLSVGSTTLMSIALYMP